MDRFERLRAGGHPSFEANPRRCFHRTDWQKTSRLMNAFLAFLKIDLKLALRNRAVLFFNYLFPMSFFFFFGWAYKAKDGGTAVLVVTMVTTIGILGSGF